LTPADTNEDAQQQEAATAAAASPADNQEEAHGSDSESTDDSEDRYNPDAMDGLMSHGMNNDDVEIHHVDSSELKSAPSASIASRLDEPWQAPILELSANTVHFRSCKVKRDPGEELLCVMALWRKDMTAKSMPSRSSSLVRVSMITQDHTERRSWMPCTRYQRMTRMGVEPSVCWTRHPTMLLRLEIIVNSVCFRLAIVTWPPSCCVDEGGGIGDSILVLHARTIPGGIVNTRLCCTRGAFRNGRPSFQGESFWIRNCRI